MEINMKKISIAAATLVMVFIMSAMVACGGGSGDNNGGNTAAGGSGDKGTVTVTMDIDFPDSSGVRDIDDARVTVENGSSVLDVLNTYAAANNIDVTMDESSASPYVTAINGVSQTDTAGWVYELNDQMVMESAADCIVSDGDKIDWDFDDWTDD